MSLQGCLNPYSSGSREHLISFNDISPSVLNYLTENKQHLIPALINSRESLRRSLLELSAFDLPELASAIIAKRPKEHFIEILARSSYLLTITLLNPKIISTVLSSVGKFSVDKEFHKDIFHLARFQREDLQSLETFSKAKTRIEEEIQDQQFLSKIAINSKQREESLSQIQSMNDFSDRFEANEKTLSAAKKIKNIAILADGIEGALWGFSPILSNVIIREKLLKQKGFTGVDSKDRAEFKGYKPIQKVGMLSSLFIGGALNAVLLPFSNSSDSKFSKWVKSWQDLNHGIYPKLGLLLTNLALPVNLSRLSASMSKIELIENLILLGTVASSWCFGHKITEDQLSKVFNRHLKRKYELSEDILVKPLAENSDKNKSPIFRESEEIQEIIKKTSHNENLQKDAIHLHSLRSVLGISAHSALVFLARMLMVSVTKCLASHQPKH